MLKFRRRALRNAATPQEVILWARLRGRQLGYKFRRQHSFGAYVADFYCPERKLVVEVDGSQHMGHELYDERRTAYFEQNGLRVIRFWNNEVHGNVDGVVASIVESLEQGVEYPLSRLPL